MRYLENFQSYNEEFDFLNKIKDYIKNKLNSYSSTVIDNIKSDLIHFCEANNLNVNDLQDVNKLKSVLLAKNESTMNWVTGQWEEDEDDRILRSGTEEEKLELQKRRAYNQYRDAKWIVDNPILHKLSRYGSLLTLILSILQFFGIKDNPDYSLLLISTGVATIIATVSFFILGGGYTTRKSAKKDVKRYLKNNNKEEKKV
jgi:hypothetical protein